MVVRERVKPPEMLRVVCVEVLGKVRSLQCLGVCLEKEEGDEGCLGREKAMRVGGGGGSVEEVCVAGQGGEGGVGGKGHSSQRRLQHFTTSLVGDEGVVAWSCTSSQQLVKLHWFLTHWKRKFVTLEHCVKLFRSF